MWFFSFLITYVQIHIFTSWIPYYYIDQDIHTVKIWIGMKWKMTSWVFLYIKYSNFEALCLNISLRSNLLRVCSKQDLCSKKFEKNLWYHSPSFFRTRFLDFIKPHHRPPDMFSHFSAVCVSNSNSDEREQKLISYSYDNVTAVVQSLNF